MTKAHPARVPEYLQHIIEAIDRATGYVAGMDAAAFEQDTRTQDAVIRALEIVGEAANKARVADPTLQSTAPGRRSSATCLCCVRGSCSCWRGFHDGAPAASASSICRLMGHSFRDLSVRCAIKRHVPTVFLTVKSLPSRTKSSGGGDLRSSKTIEWE